MPGNIDRWLDHQQKIKAWPSKKGKKTEILIYLAAKFEYGHDYTEREVNLIIDQWHTFGDYFLLRRELVESSLLSRTPNGVRYWREKPGEEPSHDQDTAISGEDI
jgi:hypothetical protein